MADTDTVSCDHDTYTLMDVSEPTDHKAHSSYVSADNIQAFRLAVLLGIRTQGRSYGEAYRKHPGYHNATVQIEGAILLADLKSAPFTARDRFAQYLIQIGFLVNPYQKNRLVNITIKDIENSLFDLIFDSIENMSDIEQRNQLHQLTLLRQIFELVSGRGDNWQTKRGFCPHLTPKTSLTMLGSVVHCYGSPKIDIFAWSTQLVTVLPRCIAFKGQLLSEADIQARTNQLHCLLAYVKDLPFVELMHFSYLGIAEFMVFRCEHYMNTSIRRTKDNDMDIFALWLSHADSRHH